MYSADAHKEAFKARNLLAHLSSTVSLPMPIEASIEMVPGQEESQMRGVFKSPQRERGRGLSSQVLAVQAECRGSERTGL